MQAREYTEVAADRVQDGITMRWVIGKPEGAPNFAMRVIEFAPGAFFPQHQHPYEHEIFVLEGEGVAVGPEGEVPMRSGATLYISPDELHGYRNLGDVEMRFICVVPHSEA